MFDNLSQRLSRVVKQLRGEARLTDANIQDALREGEVQEGLAEIGDGCIHGRNCSVPHRFRL